MGSASTSTTMKPLAVNTCHERYSLILSQVLWTLYDQVHLAKSSDPTTLSSARAAPATTGPRVTTLRAPSSSTLSSMSSEKKPNHAIASKDSSSLTVSVAAPVPAWELCSSVKSERSTRTES